MSETNEPIENEQPTNPLDMLGGMDASTMADMMQMVTNPDLIKEKFSVQEFLENTALAYRCNHELQEGEASIAFLVNALPGTDFGLQVRAVAYKGNGQLSRVLDTWTLSELFEKVSIDGLLSSMKYIAAGNAQNWDHIKALISNQAKPEINE